MPNSSKSLHSEHLLVRSWKAVHSVFKNVSLRIWSDIWSHQSQCFVVLLWTETPVWFTDLHLVGSTGPSLLYKRNIWVPRWDMAIFWTRTWASTSYFGILVPFPTSVVTWGKFQLSHFQHQQIPFLGGCLEHITHLRTPCRCLPVVCWNSHPRS